MRHRILTSLAAIALTFTAAAAIAEAAIVDVSNCVLGAWSLDTDPNGLNVRAGPGTQYAVIGNIPAALRAADGTEFAAELEITGSREGWFRTDKAVLDDYYSDEDPKVVFEGEGWVSGRLLGLLLNQSNLYTAPSHDSPLAAELYRETERGGEGPDSFMVDRLDACQGSWVEVEGTFAGERLHGWASGTCANQVTTCP